MDTWIRRWKTAVLAALCLWLAACGRATAIPVAVVSTTRPPSVVISGAPEVVCRAASQLRLRVQASADLAADPAGEWVLRSSQGQDIRQGAWPVRDGAVLISFPEGQSLPPGQYTVYLSWQETDLAQHTFLVDSQMPAIVDLSLSLAPDGPTLSRLPSDLRGFYIGYEFQGGCLGGPYWATVWDEAGEILCNESGVLAGTEGRGAFACYRADGGYLAAGDYRLEMTLMEAAAEVVDFVVEAAPVVPTPTPAPTPVIHPVACDAFFAAAGLTSAGEPFLPLVLFDWYTQVVYAGARCRNLQVGAGWRTTWFHEGELVRERQGKWQGAAEGVVWDSLTGVPRNRFLPPGAYTVTLTLEDVSMTTAFSVFDYEPVNSTDGDVITE